MNAKVTLERAAQVIAQVKRGVHADDVIRHEFLHSGRDESDLRRAVSLKVFEYFRWRGFVDGETSLATQLANTEELANRYSLSPESFTAEQLQQAVPGWLIDQMPIPEDWLRSLQCLPRLWIRARRKSAARLKEQLGNLNLPSLAPGEGAMEYWGPLDLFRTPEFRDGEFEIQDLSSQWVGALCDPQPGEIWWDACAGEGGKFLDLADRMANRGMIWVTDRSKRRLARLKHRAARAQVFNYRQRQADLLSGAPFKVRFDGVLLDAPCSGVGTWQRNPDARWTTESQDIEELAAIQKKLLRTAARQVKSGGKLVYAVCTLTRSETLDVAEWFDAEEPGFEPISLNGPGFKSVADWPTSPSRRWLGGPVCDGNGMFLAAWRRT